MELKYTHFGYIYITPQDDCHKVVDAMLETNYNEEFCFAVDFNPEFITKLMEAGFLVMSITLSNEGEDPDYFLLPKLHLVRSALFFENLHIKKSVRRLLSRYELKADVDFDLIIDRCVEKHGDAWLTPPLVNCIKIIRQNAALNNAAVENSTLNNAVLKNAAFESAALKNAVLNNAVFENSEPNHSAGNTLLPVPYVYPVSFALYRDGELAAGEFGIVCGKVYTSYSGFYEEDNAGTVQIIKTTQYLQEHGFSFFDMGMPLDYKTDLGAVDISPEEFVMLFRG
jgi:Leu/Phe-tRNA-protein transferase